MLISFFSIIDLKKELHLSSLPCSNQHRTLILIQNLEIIRLITEKYWPFLIYSVEVLKWEKEGKKKKRT